MKYGRIVKGTREADFSTLGDPHRKIIFFMDGTGLQGLLGLSGRDVLKHIGYPEDDIQQLLNNGTRLKLIVFPANEALRPATWKNVFELVRWTYPAAVAQTIEPFLSLLESPENTFDAIETGDRPGDPLRYGPGGCPFKEVDKAGPSHPEYLSVERFLQTKTPTLREIRAFLYYNLRLNELFTGTGYTKTPDGAQGTPEFVGLNRPVCELDQPEVIDITL